MLAVTGARGQETTWPEESYNRQPELADLVLPMPCGGAMVFRPIDVPGSGIFDDQRIVVGSRDPERAFIENTRPAFISGTFRIEGAWRYYLGKYEVTTAQYDALNGSCPDAERSDASLPKVKLTMAEAVFTAERYTEWLFTNTIDDARRHRRAAERRQRRPAAEQAEEQPQHGQANHHRAPDPRPGHRPR